MKVFISWSKDTSKEVAFALHNMITEFFRSRSLNIYMSAAKIDPADNWFDSIREAITGSDLCIIVLTDENELSRWIYFEAGAIAFNTKSSNIIPLLITSRDVDRDSPLNHFQYIRYSYKEIMSLFSSIKRIGGLTGVRRDDFDRRFESLYPEFLARIQSALDNAVTGAVAHVPFGRIYPHDTNQVEAGKVFIGAPMASHRSAMEYAQTKAGVGDIVEAVEICCSSVRKTYWAGSEIPSSNRFDGEQTALLRDLSHLKSSVSCIFVLFDKLPTSVLIEIGYAIALNKAIIVFCKSRDDLPFLLKRADNQISNLSIYECGSYAEAVAGIERDGETMLKCVI